MLQPHGPRSLSPRRGRGTGPGTCAEHQLRVFSVNQLCRRTPGGLGAVGHAYGGFSFSRQLHGYLENEPLTLQLFIGTADDRLLRPHAFYQVHRITGKTVSTTSHEAILSNTKVLEIPLLPENNMRAM